ncbi:MAG: hypothetical protein ABSH20_12135 [Tepidisphaeraceae bacterium]|jgi:hypothetical protein
MPSAIPTPPPSPLHPPSYRLYPPGAIACATFFGGPFAGCVILAMNYRRLGRRSEAIKAVVGGALATIVIVTLSVILPLPDVFKDFFRLATLGIYWGMFYVAKRLLDFPLRVHRQHGGQLGSRWVGVGIGSICLVLILGVVVSVVAILDKTMPEALPLRFVAPSGKHDVRYTKDIPSGQAEALYWHLRHIGIFTGDHPASDPLLNRHLTPTTQSSPQLP